MKPPTVFAQRFLCDSGGNVVVVVVVIVIVVVATTPLFRNRTRVALAVPHIHFTVPGGGKLGGMGADVHRETPQLLTAVTRHPVVGFLPHSI